MWIGRTPMRFIQDYLAHLNEGLEVESPGKGLSALQILWIGFCLMGILLTNTICWAKFERMSFAAYTQQALSWMFRHSKLPWDKLLRISVGMILRKFGIKGGYLLVDDKNHHRSKNAKKLHRLHKIKDKKTGGYVLGQNLVMLYFVTEKISIPVGFSFYAPDPDQKQWRATIKQMKKDGISKELWPPAPHPLADYPKKYEIAHRLLKEFKDSFPAMNVKAVLADNLYGHLPFIQGIEVLWPGMQVITKMRKNQKIHYGKRAHRCDQHFASYGGWEQKLTIRGRESKTVWANGGRLYVPSHSSKRFVIAMKYDGEKEYRYLMATNLSWNMKEVMSAFSVRWLIEVFFEDWSGHHGFCSLAKQCGEEGSLRPLILSLLFDHCFLFHEDQRAFLEHQQPLATFGSLIEKTRVMALCDLIQQILEEESPKIKLQQLVDGLEELYPLRPSKKHMIDILDKHELRFDAA
jgi:hypothetical protein